MCGVIEGGTLAFLRVCSRILQRCVGITDRESCAGRRAVLRNIKEEVGCRGLEYCVCIGLKSVRTHFRHRH